MGHTLRQRGGEGAGRSYLKGIHGFGEFRHSQSDPGDRPPQTARRESHGERPPVEFLSEFSTRHAEELRRLRSTDDDASRERRLLGWCAQFSSRSETRLRELTEKEIASKSLPQPGEQFTRALRESRSWDASKHPRGGYPENRGWWSPAGGGSSGKSGSENDSPLRNLDRTGFDPGTFANNDTPRGAEQWHGGDLLAAAPRAKPKARAPKTPPAEIKFNPAQDGYLPSLEKGRWLGKEGESFFVLKQPIKGSFGTVDRIEFKGGFPDFDKFRIAGKSPTILLTGDTGVDIDNAKTAWTKLNGADDLGDVVFHHDALHVTETVAVLNNKESRVLVGELHPIPREIHEAIYHQGSASIGRRFYEAIDIDQTELRKLAKREAAAAKLVRSAAKQIVPGELPDSLKPHAGRRRLGKILPIIGTGLAIYSFADDVRAEGLAKAALNATPVLGDLIAAHELGSEIAREIVDRAEAKAKGEQDKHDSLIFAARKEADMQTVEAFREIAPEIEVTNLPSAERDLVNPTEVAEALAAYRARMQIANWHRDVGSKHFDYSAAAAEAKRDLRNRLIKASQQYGPSSSPKTRSVPLS